MRRIVIEIADELEAYNAMRSRPGMAGALLRDVLTGMGTDQAIDARAVLASEFGVSVTDAPPAQNNISDGAL